MASGNRIRNTLSKFETVLCVVLFVAMLFTCGLYINIKMNGKTSNLPSLPENHRHMLLKSVAVDLTAYNDDLLEPIFVGFKDGNKMIAALHENDVRLMVESTVYESLQLLFSGSSEKINFNSIAKKNEFFYNLKNSDRYMLISFLGDVPSTVFLPCISQNIDTSNEAMDLFYIKHIFILPEFDPSNEDEDKMYAITISKDNEAYMIHPQKAILFNNIISNSYDVNDGFAYFEFLDKDGIYPVFSTSFLSKKYKVSNLAVDEGKDTSLPWIQNCFEIFSINPSLVRSFTSGDGRVTTYVDNQRELVVSDDGKIVFNAADDGIFLNEFLEYYPEDGYNYSIGDIIVAIKNIVNGLKNDKNPVSYSIVGIDYDADDYTFVIYMKLIVEGITVTQEEYDAVFKIRQNKLYYAEIPTVVCNVAEGEKLLIPQKYSSVLVDGAIEDASVTYCPILVNDDGNEGIYSVNWAVISISDIKEGNDGNR